MSIVTGVRQLARAWARYEPEGAEYAQIDLGEDRLGARGVAVSSAPVPYRLEYELETVEGFVTSRLRLRTQGLGWSRALDLQRADDGTWSAQTESEGELDEPAPGGDMTQFGDALDIDLELCPTFNTMPTLRHDLLNGGEAPEMLMVWVAAPSLAVYPSTQLYSYRGRDDQGRHVVHFEAPDPDEGDFVEDVVFDDDGIVLDYPTIARRIG